MNIVESEKDIRSLLTQYRDQHRIALVPTMGCLHEGHASLIRKAGELADVVVVSVYVNPLQFGPHEDLSAYPRTPEADKEACETLGVDVMFHPGNLYVSGWPNITLHASALSDVLCGATRPGHFDGVVTVVNILFNIVQPDIAVFGEKDWQQIAIIRRMVRDLHIQMEIEGCETVREPDGLTMSSRNRYLSAEERKRAVTLHTCLQKIREKIKEGEMECGKLLNIAGDDLKIAKIDPEYLTIRDPATFSEITRITNRPARAFIAATIGKARLIDNIALETS